MTLCQDHTKSYIFDLTGDDKFDPQSIKDLKSISGIQTTTSCSGCKPPSKAHKCLHPPCTHWVAFSDEPYCYTHSPWEN
ncbi:MAG: hypothetical protein ACOYK3_00295 [Flavobacterium sp.]